MDEPKATAEEFENVLDFRVDRIIFEGCDLNLTRVSSRDWCEGNASGKAIDALIRAQTEEYIDRDFSANPDRYNGYLLTDRNKDLHPVGQIFYVKHTPPVGPRYCIQPLYLIVHPKYRRRRLSEVLRLILLYDQLVREPGNAHCEEVLVIPAVSARKMVYLFFGRLCPELGNFEGAHLLPRYTLDSKTIRENLPVVLDELKIRVVD